MSIRKRLSQEESRTAALDAARTILLEEGPQAVTLKAVAARIGRTHANLLHHFGSAAGLQSDLARHLAGTICATIAEAVMKHRAGLGTERDVVDLTFDAFDKEGGAALASWVLATGNASALDPIVDAIHDLVERVNDVDSVNLRQETLVLVLLALGDAQLGAPLGRSLGLPRSAARDAAEAMLNGATEKATLKPGCC